MDEPLSTILAAVIGAIFGFTASFLTLRFNYHDLYSKTVSANRMEWINRFREEVGVIIACLRSRRCGAGHARSAETGEAEHLFEAEKARAMLLTRLNMDTSRVGNEYNMVFADLLARIDFSAKENMALIEDELIHLSRKILEPEWRRVKDEAKGRER